MAYKDLIKKNNKVFDSFLFRITNNISVIGHWVELYVDPE